MPSLTNLLTVVSITATDPLTTNSDTVHYTITFSEAVTGVTADQFSVVTTGSLSGAGVISVAPVAGSNGASYVVTVNTGSGSGTLGLDLSGTNVRDSGGNPVGPFQSESVIGGPRFSLINPTAEGDVNGDGKPDVVVVRTASAFGNSLDIKLNDGTGHFTSSAVSGTSDFPSSVGLADANGDGKLDVLMGDYTTGTLDVRLGNGDGTFAAATKYAAGTSPVITAVADFNGDGKADVLMAGNSGVSLLFGSGDGSFGAPIATDVSGSIASGDFNGDGKIDLLVQNSSGSAVSVRLGNGDGTFQAPIEAGSASTYFSGDFNGDGKLDLALETSNSISVLLGNGDGTFGSPQTFQTPATIRSAAAADVNGDGKSDILVVGTDNTLSSFYSHGDGTFGQAVTLPLDSSAGGMTVGDLNGDGKADVVVEYQTSNGFNGEDVLLTGPGPTTAAYRIDRVTPVLTIVDAAVTPGTDGKNYINAAHFNGGATTLSGTASAGATVTVTNAADNSVVGTAVAGADGTWALGVSGLQDGSTYSYVASANGSTGSALTFTVDASPPAPAITDISPANGINISGTIDVADAAVSVIVTEQYSAAVGTTATVVPNPDGSWLLPDLLPSTSYSKVLVSAQATDAAGNVWATPAITVIYGGYQINAGTSLTGALVLRHGSLLTFGATIGTKLWSGTSETVQGSSTGLLVQSGAAQHVIFGGRSNGATIEAGGYQDITYATATDTVLFGNQQVQNAGNAVHTEVKAGAQQFVGSGGTASNTVIDASGVQFVNAGGNDVNATIAGGTQYVNGTATGTTIGAGGVQYDYGTASGAVIESGGVQHVYQGGSADGTTVAAGGYQDVYQGSVSNTMLEGQQQVLAGGRADGTTIDAGGRQYVGTGGMTIGTVVAAGGLQYVDAGAADDSATIDGGWQYVTGTVTGATVGGRGEQDVGAGGTATNTHLDGGTEHVYAGGLAQNVDFAGSSGSTLVLDTPSGLAGSIANFGTDDYIDFRNTVISRVDVDSSNNLTVTTDGGESYSWTLLAQYSASSFVLSADGSGGTQLSYQPPQQALLAAAH